MTKAELAAVTDEELERMVGWLVGRTHVSTSDRGLRSFIGRKLNKEIQGAERKRVLDAIDSRRVADFSNLPAAQRRLLR